MIYMEKRDPKISPSYYLYFAVFASLLAPIAFGLVLGFSNPANEYMQRGDSHPQVESNVTLTWISSCVNLGAPVGALLAGPLNAGLGKKVSIIGVSFPLVTGWLLIGLSTNIGMILGGRTITGLCTGFICGSVPGYINEISPPSIRGILGGCFQLSVTIGILIAACIGMIRDWKLIALISAIPALLLPFFMFFAPETPQYLLSKQHDQQENIKLKIRKIRSKDSNIDFEIASIQADSSGEVSRMFLSCRDLSKKSVYKSLLCSIGLMVFQQFSGINAVIFYQVNIFKDSHSSLDAHISAILVCLAQVIATFAGSFLVDKFGRKPLLMVSSVGNVLSLVVLGFFFYKVEGNPSFGENYGTIALVSLIGFMVSFSIGHGPIPWMMIPEITPYFARSFISAIATSFNWIFVFIITKEFKELEELLTPAGAFWSFGFISFIGLFFIYFCLPETKGKPFKEILEFYGEDKEFLEEDVEFNSQDLGKRKSLSTSEVINKAFEHD